MNEANKHVEHTVYIGIGSNINPRENLARALDLLRQQVSVEKVAQIWITPAVGGNGPDYLNTAALVRTRLPPEALKDQVLRKIEAQLGRVRTEDKFASRTIDLDILVVDGKTCDSNIWVYVFQAVPLADLLPGHVNSETGETLAQAAGRLAKTTRIKLFSSDNHP